MKLTSDETVEESRIIGPMPSPQWHREHAAKLERQIQQADEEDTQGFLSSMLAKAQAETAAWASLPCLGEVEHVERCSPAQHSTCARTEHVMCPRRQRQRSREERARELAKMREDFKKAGMKRRVLEAVFDNEPWETEAVKALRAAFASTPTPCIVVLQGGTGCGKGCAGALWAIEHRARWITAKAFSRLGYDKELADLGQAGALVLDDLGTEFRDAKGFFDSNFDGLIDDRYADMLPTVITTNVAPDEFKARYGERIADRIREAGRFVQVGGQSLRRRA